MLRIRRGGRDHGEDNFAITSSPSVMSIPTPTPTPTTFATVPMITLDDGRVVPPITLDDGRVVTPIIKGDGQIASAVSEYSTSSFTSTFDPTSATSSSPPSSAATVLGSPASETSPTVIIPSSASSSGPFNPNGEYFWNNFSEGVKAAIIISIIIGFFSVIIASIWFCCGRPRRRRQKERQSVRLDDERQRAIASGSVPGASVERLPVPLRTMHSREGPPPQAPGAHHSGIGRVASRLGRHMSLRGGDAPPRYEEVVPTAHQRVAGGMRNSTGEEDGMGLVADGKMPLSEIPFEDVVLEPARSEASSSRDFGERHARGGGDTRGHTNS